MSGEVRGRGVKLRNAYSRTLGSLYDRIPKAVLAAVAVSFATQGGDFLDEAEKRVLEEWTILYQNGIVPQRPPGGTA